MRIRGIVLTMFAAAQLAMGAQGLCAQEQILHAFPDFTGDGAFPKGGLIMDTAGNFYGTTSGGGGVGYDGTVFELSPPTSPGGKWTENILYIFPETGGGGQMPAGTLVMDTKGNLFGTAGGNTGAGVVFELSPPASPGGKWTQTEIDSFSASMDGSAPEAGLIFDKPGDLYGVTENGGENGAGTVFELTPQLNGTWKESILFSFSNTGAMGFRPQASLIIDGAGNLYGTTANGGGTAGAGQGVVFELSPPSSGTTWTPTVLHTFGETLYDADTPLANLYMDSQGNLYGTAYALGCCDIFGGNFAGIAFELTPPTTPGGTWTEILLWGFLNNGIDGNNPASGLTPDGQGNLYGTTLSGGNPVGASGSSTAGTIYELLAPTQTGGNWSEQVVYYFGASGSDGFTSAANLIEDGKGNFYGTTQYGGNDLGTVFEFTPLTAAATPTFTVPAGTYSIPQTVRIEDTTPGAVIYYTLDGSTPTTKSFQYTGAIPVSTTETISAIAAATDYYTSAVATATYTIHLAYAATPVFSPASGIYPSTRTVTITDATAGAKIYYTTNGNAPSITPSELYKGPLTVAKEETIRALASAAEYVTSAIGDGYYTITAATPVITPDGGTYTKAQTITITGAPGLTIVYTINGTSPNPDSTKYTKPISVKANETIEAIAFGAGLGASVPALAKYTINPSAKPAAKPIFSITAGTYKAEQKVKISDATKGASIYYTTTGKAPSTAWTKYSAPVTVAASETLEAIAIATGSANSAVATAKYVIEKPAATPTIKPAGGTFTAPKPVTITDATPNAAIYYTTTGAAPTTASTKYTKAFTVSKPETVKAIAVATGYSESVVASEKFNIN